MHRLVSLRLASNFSKKNTFSLQSHPYKSVSGLTRPAYQDPVVGSSLTNPFHHFRPCQSHHSLSSGTTRGFLSNTLLVKQFLSSNTHLRVSSRGLNDFKVGYLRAQFRRGISGFGSGFNRKSWFHQLNANDAVFGLIVANVAVFMLWRIADRRFMVENFMISLDNIKSGRVHTMITSAFSHIDLEHIISNMIGLYFFGMNIGRTFGPEFLLKLYLAGAIGGSVFYLVHHALMASSSKGQGMSAFDPSRTPGLGASGAVNAILLLDIFLHPKATLYFDFIIPVPAMLLGIFLIGKDILRIIEGESNISGSAHLGGAVVAAIAWARIKKGRF
ncbi:RHOMBOID-like protein 12, mitochondrial isoform X2 [Tripterygium wilfordii]|uniref:RHOMBOID-like protein 12, mitochondrial isoform X2 n=1 Tax=Tripterygium wilfordii TaxID=458696 RepID=UPI0018F7EA5C|nr:RHOMBOID-like protein 12, mitochondrial isoform X2 [Tripterygium wilfordii]